MVLLKPNCSGYVHLPAPRIKVYRGSFIKLEGKRGLSSQRRQAGFHLREINLPQSSSVQIVLHELILRKNAAAHRKLLTVVALHQTTQKLKACTWLKHNTQDDNPRVLEAHVCQARCFGVEASPKLKPWRSVFFCRPRNTKRQQRETSASLDYLDC